MKKLNRIGFVLLDIQILSAIIWASTIIACSWIADKSLIPIILTSAAGFHVILMAQFSKGKIGSK